MAPRSQESQDLIEQLEIAPSVEDSSEKIEEIEPEIINNNEGKYFVEFKANIKGNRKQFGLIVETENKDDIPNIVSKKLKKEYTGVRTINCMSINNYEETNKEYTTDIEPASTRITSSDLSEETNNTNQPEFTDEELNSFIDVVYKVLDRIQKSIYKVVITPGRVPKLKDMKNFQFIIEKSESIIRYNIKEVARELGKGNVYKDKHTKIIRIPKEALRNNKDDLIKLYKSFKSFTGSEADIISTIKLDKLFN